MCFYCFCKLLHGSALKSRYLALAIAVVHVLCPTLSYVVYGGERGVSAIPVMHLSFPVVVDSVFEFKPTIFSL